MFKVIIYKTKRTVYKIIHSYTFQLFFEESKQLFAICKNVDNIVNDNNTWNNFEPQ